jgi:Spy/CpxP family protein refolding chaperone
MKTVLYSYWIHHRRIVMKHIMIALTMAMVSNMVLAQPEGTPPGGPNADGKRPPPIERMKDNLGLTDEQVKKMREIRDQGGSREEMAEVLTPEQRAKAGALRKEHAAKIQETLGLTREQKKKMAEIRKQGGSREEMRAVLTPEQQAKFDALRGQGKAQRPKPKPASSSTPTPAPAPLAPVE